MKESLDQLRDNCDDIYSHETTDLQIYDLERYRFKD